MENRLASKNILQKKMKPRQFVLPLLPVELSSLSQPGKPDLTLFISRFFSLKMIAGTSFFLSERLSDADLLVRSSRRLSLQSVVSPPFPLPV